MRRNSFRMMRNLCQYDSTVVSNFLKVRPGETKVGQALQLLPPSGNDDTVTEFLLHLQKVVMNGARFAIIGIPEDIGPRANLGRGGANEAYPAFLKHFLNLQANQYIKSDEILLVGHVECTDLQDRSQNVSVDELRGLCSELDYRVDSILHPIFSAGLIPIVIGGGHNNCFPIIKSLSTHCERAINAINLDPHADFRAIEGRHSGNGFSYARENGYLNCYHVMGLNELKNNQAILSAMHDAGCTYDSYQSIFHRRRVSFDEALASALFNISRDEFGVELDVDCITGMPVSAYNECGVTVDVAAHYIYQASSSSKSKYLHLCEAAPRHHPSGLEAGNEAVGQILASLTSTFIQAKQL